MEYPARSSDDLKSLTYEERNVIVSLFVTLLIGGFYGLSLLRMIRGEGLNPVGVFSLWGIMIVMSIITTIFGSILTQIALSIVHAIRTREKEEYRSDERDTLIELKGSRSSYWVFSAGVFLAMLSLVLNQPPLVMFNLLIIAGIVASLAGDVSRLYLYRRGF
jgi:hypothetical protein